MKATAMHLLWRTALALHLFSILAHGRCPGYKPALCWIPTSDENEADGYYRGGILAQYCVRFAHHRGRCLATIDHFGRPLPGGSHFTPETR